ncbi:nitrogen regulatory protein P-II [Methanothermococcus okinawensis IH1]|uniref:Nitrogen regulatory protein P-II n=2 Tax=Methanothermococcus okinawensis TaxID=155863 RepID=F8ALJ0_METOI|nr:nitrogen regulatory protein P-II [Methanothermococcus okinawensis IH1]
MAIVRPNLVKKTTDALSSVGFPAMTMTECFGRGKQKGYFAANMPDVVDMEKVIKEGKEMGLYLKYIPKRLISIVVEDADVPLVVGVIMKINRTGKHGDGKIFVLPTEETIRIRTGETGDIAIGN